MHARTTITLTAVCLLALTACGSNDTRANTTTSSRPSTAASSSTPTNTTPLDAAHVVKALTTTVTTAKPATVYTAATDPKQLLGRPGGYTSKADFTDQRAKPKLDEPVQRGGCVEVFEDPALAEKRSKLITTTLEQLAVFGTEYHYLKGGILLRVSGALTPGQAAEYETALKQLT